MQAPWRPGEAPGLYVATGFNGWGISNGTAAAMLIADQVQDRANPWSELYDQTLRKSPKKYNKGGDTKSMQRGIAQGICPGPGRRDQAGQGENRRVEITAGQGSCPVGQLRST